MNPQIEAAARRGLGGDLVEAHGRGARDRRRVGLRLALEPSAARDPPPGLGLSL